MATTNYELRKGVLLQEFGFPEKACTNDSLTDALAEWHLKRHPEKSVLFVNISPSFMPSAQVLPSPPPPPERSLRGVKQIIAPEPIIILPSKIAQEDPAKRKILVDQALALGFKSSPENRIELISSDELKIIISNLEKAKELKEPEVIESSVPEIPEETEVKLKKTVKRTVKTKK